MCHNMPQNASFQPPCKAFGCMLSATQHTLLDNVIPSPHTDTHATNPAANQSCTPMYVHMQQLQLVLPSHLSSCSLH